MNELSRMQRHQGRNKGRKNKSSAQSEKKAAEKPLQAGGHRSRSKSQAPASTAVPKPRGGRAADGLSRSRSTRSNQNPIEEEVSAPKRTNTYSSYRVRMSKWFVNSLIVIFILLMVGLLWWGLIGAPPLRELLKEIL